MIIVVFSCIPRRGYSEVAIIVIIVLIRRTSQTKCLPFTDVASQRDVLSVCFGKIERVSFNLLKE